MIEYWIFSDASSVSVQIIAWFSFFQFVNIVNYIDWFSYFKPVLHSWAKPCLYMIYSPFYSLLGLTCHSLFTTLGICIPARCQFVLQCSVASDCDPTDCSPPGSSVHGLLQTRILEWGAISFSRGPSQSRDRTRLLRLLHWQVGLVAPGTPYWFAVFLCCVWFWYQRLASWDELGNSYSIFRKSLFIIVNALDVW